MSAGRLMVCAVVCCNSYLFCKLKLTAENRRLVFKVQIFVPHTAKKAKISKKLQFTRILALRFHFYLYGKNVKEKSCRTKFQCTREAELFFTKYMPRLFFLSYANCMYCMK